MDISEYDKLRTDKRTKNARGSDLLSLARQLVDANQELEKELEVFVSSRDIMVCN